MTDRIGEIVVREEGHTGWLVLSNPSRHNAVTYAMWRAIPEALQRLGSDPDIRIVAICGEGDEAFVSGGDISEFETVRATREADAEYNRAVDEACLAPLRCPKPVLAKIHGTCMGGGIALAASCDVCIASDQAVFRMPAARLGVGYWFNGIQRLVHILGPRNTADIFFSAHKFDAHEALRMGLLTRVVPRAGLDDEFARYCAMIGDNAPLTASAAKAAIVAALQDSETRDMAALEERILGCWASDDYREGRDAFLQKRRPKFSGT